MKQRSLFEDDIPAWEQDDVRLEPVASVIFPKGLDGTFDYRVPKNLASELAPGLRVMVPLGRGNRETLGYCIAVEQKEVASKTLKEVIGVVDDQRLISDKMLRLTRWIADYYLCPQGQVFEAVLPAGVRDNAGTRLTSILYVPDDFKQKLDTLAGHPNAKSALLTPKHL